MPITNNLRLLFLSLLFSFYYARPGIFPSPSPAPEPSSPSGSPPASSPSTEVDEPVTVSDTSPSPSPQADGPVRVSNPPSTEVDEPVTVDGPSPSPATISNGPSPSHKADGTTTISISPSPSPGIDGPTTVSDGPSSSSSPKAAGISDSPSPSPNAAGSTTVSNSPSPSPNTAGPATVSDRPSPSPNAARTATVSDGPTPFPEADGPTTASDGPSQSNLEEARRSRPTLSPSPEADGPTTASEDFNSESTLGPSAVDITPKVQQICDSTNHSKLCQTILLPHLDGDNNATAELETAIRTAAQLANIGLVLAKTTASDTGVPPELTSILVDCRDSYDYAVYNLESTLDAYPTQDVGAMKNTLSAAIKDVEDCEDGLSKYGKESPFASVAEKLVKMTNNCLAIVSLLN